MSEPSNQNAQRERRAHRLLRKSVEHQIHLAYAHIPQEAVALCSARLEVRAWLVSCGYLTVEELESLARDDAIATARRRLDALMARPVTGLRDRAGHEL